LSGSSVARLLRVNELIPEIKNLLDRGDMNLIVTVQSSYTIEEIQKAVVASGKEVSKEIAKSLREDDITKEAVVQILSGESTKGKSKQKSVQLSPVLYNKYFKGEDRTKIEEIVDKALAAWFAAEGGVDV